MTKRLSFSYESIGNFAKLLSTILYEKEHSAKDITLWHQRFDNKEADDLFESFLEELFPQGGKLDREEIMLLTNHAERFLSKDPLAIQQRVAYDKGHYPLWVYFKIDQKVFPCDFAKHSNTVKEICVDYFKDFEAEDLSPEYIQKFIIDNFEICSDNTTIEKIANDSLFIFHSIVFRDRRKANAENN